MHLIEQRHRNMFAAQLETQESYRRFMARALLSGHWSRPGGANTVEIPLVGYLLLEVLYLCLYSAVQTPILISSWNSCTGESIFHDTRWCESWAPGLAADLRSKPHEQVRGTHNTGKVRGVTSYASALTAPILGDEAVQRVIKQAGKHFRRKIPRYGANHAPYPFDLVPQ